MYDVHLYIYDLSNGLAAQISMQLTGRFFKAIYHTSVTVHGREYFFGGSGVESSLPGQSPYGVPIERRKVGETEIDPDLWHSFLEDCAEDYGVGKYHLLEHNCNTFSDAALQFLLGQRIDPEISSLPSDFLNTSLGRMLRPQIDSMYAPRPGAKQEGVTSNGKSSIKTEVAIDGPTSGTHRDRTEEAYSFINTPTLTKLFAKLQLQHPDADLRSIQTMTESIVQGKASSANLDFAPVGAYLTKYFAEVPVAQVFPGLDLVRILVLHDLFGAFLCSHPATLESLVALDYRDDESSRSSESVLLKLICNALLQAQLRAPLIALLRKHDKLELISNAPLSGMPDVRIHGLQCIWNLLVLADGVDDDFCVACLASVAECKSAQAEEDDDDSKSAGDLATKIVKELMSGASEAVQEMAEILELEG